ncbi:sigma-70 family RNA polymerase sigma factor [Actinomadura litoris]|uniref:Uncharacterized protein n=1 Tax=Actinomadura litoris TaxID=2678616 RepID=A0A7K1KT54_9ACTN|nr:sigma-70 family RNA polymerase sigma factor [Actinomadura litoris]MUN35370.1 hypothetical protein [Actinomadura litoris]
MHDHQTTNQRPSPPTTTGPYAATALTLADNAFRLLTTGPDPLSVDGKVLGHGLPARAVSLTELRELLLEQAASDELKDTAWRELLRQARTGDPDWVLGCVGVAMPGLKRTAARVIRSSPDQLVDDIVSELLTEFVAQLARIDTQRPHIAARLMLWARKGALRARSRESRDIPLAPWDLPDRPAAAAPDPIMLVLDAARQGIIDSAAAELVIATRLDATSVQTLAQARGIPASRLYKQRQAAEARLVAAIKDGQVSAISASPASAM